MTSRPHRFILQASDPEYGHPAFATMFVVESLEDFDAVLGKAADKRSGCSIYRYTLEPRSSRDPRKVRRQLRSGRAARRVCTNGRNDTKYRTSSMAVTNWR